MGSIPGRGTPKISKIFLAAASLEAHQMEITKRTIGFMSGVFSITFQWLCHFVVRGSPRVMTGKSYTA